METSFKSKTKNWYGQLNNSPKDRIEIEVGDSKDAEVIQPQVKLMRWDNKCNLSVRLKTDSVKSYSSSNGKIKWSNDKHKISFYEIDDGYEMEISLDKIPDTNVVEFSLNTKGLSFYYQPPLTEEIGIERIATATETHGYDKNGVLVDYRPENVVGSYAVYLDGEFYNMVGGKEYKCGKVAHIYRPRIEDKKGNWTWGELFVDVENSILRVTIPQEFLDKAVYPIKHVAGLTIGTTSVGGTTSSGWASGESAGSWVGTSPGTDVYPQNINIYTVDAGKNMKGFVMIYVSSYSFLTNSTTPAGTSSANSWLTMNNTGNPHYTDTGSTDYIEPWVVFGTSNSSFKRDTTSSGQNSGYGTTDYTTPAGVGSYNGTTYKYSIYMNYSATSGTTYTPTLTDTFSSSEVLNRSTTHVVIDTKGFSEVFNRLIDKVRSDSGAFVEVLNKSEQRTLSDTQGTSEVLNKEIDRTITDTQPLSDSITRSESRTLSDSNSLSDVTNKSLQRSVSDSMSFSEVLATLRTAYGLVVDTVSGSDGIVKNIQRSISDSSTITEAFEGFRAIVREYVDNFSLSEILTRSATIVRAESQSMSEVINKSVSTNKSDTFGTSEELTNVSGKLRNMSDTFTPVDSVTRQTTRVLSSTVTFSEVLERLLALGKELSDTFGISEFLTKTKSLFRSISDEVPVSDSITRSITKGLTSTFSFTEKIIKYLNGFVVQWIKVVKNLGDYTKQVKQDGSYTKQVKPTGDWDRTVKTTEDWDKQAKPDGTWSRGEPPIN